jgi:xylose dehydrogenase (NAD/NADP)
VVKWGILSTARINDKLLPGARAAEHAEVVAVASRHAGRAESYAREHGIERPYGSYERLLEDPEIDVVYIPLPNALHLEWTQRALEAGKHVLCEKPLSRRRAEVEEAFDAAERHGRLLMEAFMYRHHPQTRCLSELVAGGAIGQLRLIRGVFSFATRDPADVRLSSALGGGALMDVGCYCVNAARLLAGEPERVSAEQVLGGDGVDIVMGGSMRHAAGVISQFDCGLALAPRDELEVVGDRGSLWLDDPWHGREPVIELRTGAGTERVEVEHADPYHLEVENFSLAVLGELEPLLGRADAVGQAQAIEALYAAAAQ